MATICNMLRESMGAICALWEEKEQQMQSRMEMPAQGNKMYHKILC